MSRRTAIAAALIAGLLVGALLASALRLVNLFGGADPEAIAAASLQSVQEQARLTPFAARFVAVVTSTQSRFGLQARKTLIMPGLVRYEVDLARLKQKDLRWDPNAKTLNILLPPLEVSGPEVDLGAVQEYSGGGVLMAFTDADRRLDEVNRRSGQQELVRQAREKLPMRLAREAARRAVERSFAMPLKAAGIEAKVAVRFRDEGTQRPSTLDRSRRIEDVLNERQAAQ